MIREDIGYEQIGRQLDDRLNLLSAFSHDMQTPITRMRLRAELAEDFPDREKHLNDLDEIECLIRDSIAYARNAHTNGERHVILDLRSFAESIVFDYQDTGRDVAIEGEVEGTIRVKPMALKRILSNFIDNALKFAGAARICVSLDAQGRTTVAVLDRGPGIPPDKLDEVRKPFVRLERPGKDERAGFGLGLAIAHQLAHDLGAAIVLQNRPGGGLSAQVSLR